MDKEKLDFIKANGKVVKVKAGEIVRFDTDTSHHYWLNEVYKYSLTAFLSEAGPVPARLKDWFQNNTKEEADQRLELTGSLGTKMHDAFERSLNGEELNLLTEYKTIREKKILTSFADWFQAWKPNELESEQIVASEELDIAGTLDFKANYFDKKLLLDFKTTGGIYFNHFLQAVGLSEMYNESRGEHIDFMGIARFGTIHKGNGKINTIKIGDRDLPLSGKGWEVKMVPSYITWDTFKSVYNTFLALHKGEIPEPEEIEAFPEVIRLFENVRKEEK